jgi:hypothetical protein
MRPLASQMETLKGMAGADQNLAGQTSVPGDISCRHIPVCSAWLHLRQLVRRNETELVNRQLIVSNRASSG